MEDFNIVLATILYTSEIKKEQQQQCVLSNNDVKTLVHFWRFLSKEGYTHIINSIIIL
jgi:hypothetical protein